MNVSRKVVQEPCKRGGCRVSLTKWEENLVVVAIFDRVAAEVECKLKPEGFMVF